MYCKPTVVSRCCLSKVLHLWTFKVDEINSTLTSTWLHLRCDVGLEEGEYQENCICATVLCTIIMVHKGTSSSYRSVDYIGL